MSGEQSKSYQTIKDLQTEKLGTNVLYCLLTLLRENTDLTGKGVNPTNPAFFK